MKNKKGKKQKREKENATWSLYNQIRWYESEFNNSIKIAIKYTNHTLRKVWKRERERGTEREQM